MFIVFLKFSSNKAKARLYMEGHKQWIEDNNFLLVGSLKPALGGFILTDGDSIQSIKQIVSLDPFVIEDVVTAEIIEVTPNQADERLSFLL